MLHLVATPIGNLKDITLRGIETLQSITTIICEDTRRTSILLNHYKIKKPLITLNDFNESLSFLQIIARLKFGEEMALVSDAGTPLISDPGYKLVRECITQNIPVDSLPGPSAVIVALTLSGLPPDKFMFLGYPPEKPGHRLDLFKKMLDINQILKTTYILFVAPHKLAKTLVDMKNVLGDVEITLASELTKIHQNVLNKKISDWQILKAHPKGEYVLLLNLG